jgi:hypothetical protein
MRASSVAPALRDCTHDLNNSAQYRPLDIYCRTQLWYPSKITQTSSTVLTPNTKSCYPLSGDCLVYILSDLLPSILLLRRLPSGRLNVNIAGQDQRQRYRPLAKSVYRFQTTIRTSVDRDEAWRSKQRQHWKPITTGDCIADWDH